MTHDLFGKLKYKDGDESWAGSVRLPLFAAVGMLPDPPELTEEDAERMAAEIQAAMENMRQLMRERFGDRAEDAFAAGDEEAERGAENAEPPDPEDEERERRRAERRQKNAALLAKGRFPVRVAGPEQAGPTPAQEAAFRFLSENE